MTVEQDFEDDLFALYGEPSMRLGDAEIVDRLLRELQLPERNRRRVLLAAVGVGSILGLGGVFWLAGPLIEQLADLARAPEPLVWIALEASASAIGGAALRLVDDE